MADSEMKGYLVTDEASDTAKHLKSYAYRLPKDIPKSFGTTLPMKGFNDDPELSINDYFFTNFDEVVLMSGYEDITVNWIKPHSSDLIADYKYQGEPFLLKGDAKLVIPLRYDMSKSSHYVLKSASEWGSLSSIYKLEFAADQDVNYKIITDKNKSNDLYTLRINDGVKDIFECTNLVTDEYIIDVQAPGGDGGVSEHTINNGSNAMSGAGGGSGAFASFLLQKHEVNITSKVQEGQLYINNLYTLGHGKRASGAAPGGPGKAVEHENFGLQFTKAVCLFKKDGQEGAEGSKSSDTPIDAGRLPLPADYMIGHIPPSTTPASYDLRGFRASSTGAALQNSDRIYMAPGGPGGSSVMSDGGTGGNATFDKSNPPDASYGAGRGGQGVSFTLNDESFNKAPVGGPGCIIIYYLEK